MSTALVPIDDLASLAEKLAPRSMLPEKLRNKPHDVLAIVMAGRELGLPPWASIRLLNVIEGKPVLTADGMVAVARGSGKCVSFDMIESTDKIATFETVRHGGKPQRMSFTIEEAKTAGLTNKDNWKKHSAAMLRARAQAALCRVVYQDVLAGVYSDDEAADFSRSRAPEPIDVEPEPDVDELAWQLRISTTTSDEMVDLRADYKALPDCDAKRRLADLISKRRSALSREVGQQMQEAAP